MSASIARAQPTLPDIPEVPLLAGSPHHIVLDAEDPSGRRLSYSVTTSGDLVTAVLLVGNRSLRIQVAGFGDMVFQLFDDKARRATDHIVELADGGFYDGVIFHRVVPMTRDGDPFVIQAGDPTGTGSGGPGYWLPLEKSGLPHDFGVISMARDVPPDSAGSQFFICLSRAGTARLDGNYCAFGSAVDGADTIRAIAAVELADQAAGRPRRPPVIEGAQLVPAPPRAPGKGRPDEPIAARVQPEAAQPGRVPR